jgi:hypothetical protein
MQIPEGLPARERTHEYVERLNANLELITTLSRNYQQTLVVKREGGQRPELQNQYQPGDFVFWRLNPDVPKPNKLHAKYGGPVQVVRQHKNEVMCKNLITGSMKVLQVDTLKIFHHEGSAEERQEAAYQLALRDSDSYEVAEILAFRGDLSVRAELEFEVRFQDGELGWVPWNQTLFSSILFEEFCTVHKMLIFHKHKAKEAAVLQSQMDRRPIADVVPGDKVYVCLRQYGSIWYEELRLHDFEHVDYVFEAFYEEWANDTRKRIWIHIPITDEHYKVGNSWILQFGSVRDFDEERMFLVDQQMILDNPEILSEREREANLERIRKELNL